MLACHLKSIQVEKRTRHLMIPKLNALLTVRQAAMYRRLLSDNTRRRITDVSLRYRSAPPPLPLVCCRRVASSKPPPSGRLPSTGNGLIGMPPPPRSPPSTVKSKPKISPPAAAARSPSIIEVDVKNFVALLNSPVPVILDCYATWCDPCKKLTPVLEKIVGKYPDRVILGKLDVDKHPELAAQLKVSSLPAVFGLCEGKLVDRFVGMPTEPILAGFLDKMLSIIPPAGTDEGVDGAPSVAERQEADLAMADSLMKGENNGGKEEKDKATKAGALYKQVYEELAAEETPAPYLQARCLAGLARCALMGGAAEEARQIVQLLRTKHKAEMESIPVRERTGRTGKRGSPVEMLMHDFSSIFRPAFPVTGGCQCRLFRGSGYAGAARGRRALSRGHLKEAAGGCT